MRESSVVLYKDIVIDWQIGSSVEVEFDFIKIWKFIKILGDKFDPDHLVFLHVHPSGMPYYSQKDVECVKGLVIALGFNLSFGIYTFTDEFTELYMYRGSIDGLLELEHSEFFFSSYAVKNEISDFLELLSYS